MSRILIVGTLLLACFETVYCQRANEALSTEKNYSLPERYRILKDNSPTYNDYKEIKGPILDAWWNIVMDSVTAKEKSLAESQSKISALEKEMALAKATVDQKDAAMAEMEHGSSHINVFGLDFNKTFFITMMSIVVGGLVAIIVVIFGRLRWLSAEIREKIDLSERLHKDFEAYKRNALDKQMRLSRELQDERNKLEEMKK